MSQPDRSTELDDCPTPAFFIKLTGIVKFVPRGRDRPTGDAPPLQLTRCGSAFAGPTTPCPGDARSADRQDSPATRRTSAPDRTGCAARLRLRHRPPRSRTQRRARSSSHSCFDSSADGSRLARYGPSSSATTFVAPAMVAVRARASASRGRRLRAQPGIAAVTGEQRAVDHRPQRRGAFPDAEEVCDSGGCVSACWAPMPPCLTGKSVASPAANTRPPVRGTRHRSSIGRTRRSRRESRARRVR